MGKPLDLGWFLGNQKDPIHVTDRPDALAQGRADLGGLGLDLVGLAID